VALYFLDSSAIVKRYNKNEVGSAWLSDLIVLSSDSQDLPSIRIALISGAEVVAALTKRQRMGDLSATEAALAIGEFKDDFQNLYDTVQIDREVIEHAMGLAQRHGLRGYDAVQLASAIEVGSLARQFQLPFVFISADDKLNAAAAEEGLQTDNPNFHR